MTFLTFMPAWAEDVVYLTTEQFKARVFDYKHEKEWSYKGDKPCVIDFYTTWCGPCKAMHPVLENLKQQLGERLRIIKVDVDKYQQTAAQYGVQAVPTLMLFRSGRQLWRQSGALPLPQLMTVVNSYL